MKQLLMFSLAILILIGMAGCVTSQYQCPSSNIVFRTTKGQIVHIPKGGFNPKWEGMSWVTEEEYQKSFER